MNYHEMKVRREMSKVYGPPIRIRDGFVGPDYSYGALRSLGYLPVRAMKVVLAIKWFEFRALLPWSPHRRFCRWVDAQDDDTLLESSKMMIPAMRRWFRKSLGSAK